MLHHPHPHPRTRGAVVAEQPRGTGEGGGEDIKVAVHVVVEHSNAAARLHVVHTHRLGDIRPRRGCRRHAVLRVLIQPERGFVPLVVEGGLRHKVAVGDEQIQVCIVVVVQERGAPAPVPGTHPRPVCCIHEHATAGASMFPAVASVQVQEAPSRSEAGEFVLLPVGVDRRHEQVQPTVTVDISDRRAHSVLITTQPCLT